MRRSVMVVCVIAWVMSCAATVLHAQQMYVRDWIVIALRSAPKDSSRQVGQASTGDRLEVLEEMDGWSRVRLEGGLEGWTPSRFLSPKPPASTAVRQLEQRVAELQAELARVKGGGETRGEAPWHALTAASGGLLMTAEEAKAVQAEKEKTKADLAACLKRSEELEAENTRLKNSERLFFTFVGGLLVVLGVVIGVFIQLAGGRSKKQGYRF